jgi:2'-5' RNA ligase
VLWAGVAPAAPVAELKQAIDASLGPDPEAVDRPFHPHVTLARFKDAPGPELDEYLRRHALLASAPFEATAFHLYESRTLPDGPAYMAMHSYPLLPLTGQAPPGDRA